jgi:hypothetical protein
VDSGVHTQKTFFENYPKFGHTLLKVLCHPFIDRKFLNNISWKLHKIISLPVAPNYYPAKEAPMFRADLLQVTKQAACPSNEFMLNYFAFTFTMKLATRDRFVRKL